MTREGRLGEDLVVVGVIGSFQKMCASCCLSGV
jgi:hypothetical protein